MKTLFLINPEAGAAEEAEAVRTWAGQRENYAMWTSSGPEYARGHIRQAEEDGFDRVVAVGGDGTVSHLVDAVLRVEADLSVGLVPLGTGNDLARTLDIPFEVPEALALLPKARERRIDAIRIKWEDETRYGVNVAAGGFSGSVDEALTPELKSTWGPLAYLLGAARALPDLKDYDTHIAINGMNPQAIRALNVVVANGRTAAGGKPVAPLANPCDGQLDLVIVKWGEVANLAEVGARLVAGNYLESPLVVHRRVQQVCVVSEPGMWFNVDGELLTKEPVTITVIPEALRVLVGPAFQPEPEE